LRSWIAISLTVAAILWCAEEIRASNVTTHSFGRYEMLLQEGTPVAVGEVLGLVRRQTGLPEYPLMLGVQGSRLTFGILGPGNRPVWIASSQLPRSVTAGTARRFIVQGSDRQGEKLTLLVRRANAPDQVSLSIDLGRLQRLLEGER
jgi:hypothetical protein